MPNEDRLTRADLEKLKEAVKKNERKHISHNNEAKYYPNSKREPVKPIFDFRKKRPSPKIEPGKPPKEMPEQIKKYLEQKFQNDRSPTVTDTETGETTFGRPRKFNSGSKLKDLIGPITVRPSGTQETTVEGKVKRDTKAGSVGVGTKFGNITLSKSNVTESMPGYSDYKTKSKGISYDNSFDIGKSSKLDFNLRKGKSESSFGDSKTEGATVTFTKTFGGPKMKTGGMCRGMGKAVKGGKFTGVK
jgi:hypothetical protein